nr:MULTISPECIES: ATP-binding protein [unclassified Frankia]
MVTSNLPFGRWGETFSDDVVAAAMIDRLVHRAEVLTQTGDSYRTRGRRDLLAKDRPNRDQSDHRVRRCASARTVQFSPGVDTNPRLSPGVDTNPRRRCLPRRSSRGTPDLVRLTGAASLAEPHENDLTSRAIGRRPSASTDLMRTATAPPARQIFRQLGPLSSTTASNALRRLPPQRRRARDPPAKNWLLGHPQFRCDSPPRQRRG